MGFLHKLQQEDRRNQANRQDHQGKAQVICRIKGDAVLILSVPSTLNQPSEGRQKSPSNHDNHIHKSCGNTAHIAGHDLANDRKSEDFGRIEKASHEKEYVKHIQFFARVQ